ncbi:hypothetical protein E4U54_003006, partial [Claviceps lovelessii]
SRITMKREILPVRLDPVRSRAADLAIKVVGTAGFYKSAVQLTPEGNVQSRVEICHIYTYASF